MTLAELIQEVYTLTARPDRVTETLSAIKSATLKAHQSDYYYKDIFESGLAFSTSDYVQNWDYRATLPLYRALKYLRKYDASTGTPGKELDIISPDAIFDSYKIQKSDICYVAGAFVQINSSTQESTYLMGCYVNPNITSDGYNSWVALDHPYCIIFDAAATVFKAIGKDEEAAAYRTLVSEQISMLRTSNIVAVGF
jgi:hypothetical protein